MDCVKWNGGHGQGIDCTGIQGNNDDMISHACLSIQYKAYIIEYSPRKLLN